MHATVEIRLSPWDHYDMTVHQRVVDWRFNSDLSIFETFSLLCRSLGYTVTSFFFCFFLLDTVLGPPPTPPFLLHLTISRSRFCRFWSFSSQSCHASEISIVVVGGFASMTPNSNTHIYRRSSQCLLQFRVYGVHTELNLGFWKAKNLPFPPPNQLM